MKLFFDNCTSPTLAATIGGFLKHLNHDAIHIKDAPCGRHAKDSEWIAMLGNEREDWVVVTGDGRIAKNHAERVAFRQASLKGFVLARAYQATPIHQQAAFLLWRWPDIEKLTTLTAAPFLFELPMNRSAKMKQIPV